MDLPNSSKCDLSVSASTLTYYIWKSYAYLFAISDQGIFIIQSESTKKCIQTDKSVLILQNCNQPNKYMLWKWVSNHQLFNIGSSGCLGMDFSNFNLEQSLSIYECDSNHISLKWHCNRKTIINTLLQYMIQAKEDNMVVASLKDRHKWVSYMSNSGDICEYLNKGKTIT